MTLRVIFTKEQLEQASSLRKKGENYTAIAKILNTTSMTAKKNIREFEHFGYEEYLNLTRKKNEKSGDNQVTKKVEALITKNAIMSELIFLGDIEVCQHFLKLYDSLELNEFHKRFHQASIGEVVQNIKLSIDREKYKHRYELVAMERVR